MRVRWGPYRIGVETRGVRSSGIAKVELDGAPLAPPHAFDATSVTLDFGGLPAPSAAAAASVNSTFRTASTTVALVITFATQPHARTAAPVAASPEVQRAAAPAKPIPCAALAAAHGPSSSQLAQLDKYAAATAAAPLDATLAHAMANVARSYANGFEQRCSGLNNGTMAQLRTPKAAAGDSHRLAPPLHVHISPLSVPLHVRRRRTRRSCRCSTRPPPCSRACSDTCAPRSAAPTTRSPSNFSGCGRGRSGTPTGSAEHVTIQ